MVNNKRINHLLFLKNNLIQMKQQILNLKKKLLIVELPGQINGTDVSINHSQDDYDQLEFQYPTHEFRGLQCYDNICLPKENNYKSIGKLTDITEDQFKEWVEVKRISFGKIFYHDYQNKSEWLYVKGTAKESSFSYLEKKGIYFENPHKFPLITDKEFYDEPYSGLGFYPEIYGHAIKRWQEAEDKVWKLNNTYLFEII
jgi:hypothetical protein